MISGAWMYDTSLCLLFGGFSEILANATTLKTILAGRHMRSFILSVSADRWLTPIRNALLAHAGYAVIPALTVEAAMEVLLKRRVSAMVIANTVPPRDRHRLSIEGKKRGVPAVILDGGGAPGTAVEVYVDPSEGPEILLSALARALAKMN
jgi:hypothetical protein